MGIYGFILLLRRGGSVDEQFRYYRLLGCMELIDAYYETEGIYEDA
jgi:hypothetical protein